jgi:hypothetical protein
MPLRVESGPEPEPGVRYAVVQFFVVIDKIACLPARIYWSSYHISPAINVGRQAVNHGTPAAQPSYQHTQLHLTTITSPVQLYLILSGRLVRVRILQCPSVHSHKHVGQNGKISLLDNMDKAQPQIQQLFGATKQLLDQVDKR